ncbi:MAG: MBOAT family protein [Ruminococcaceae bacterium]|nr:MBOAT family protein [Oscillospiraceae bacterium]
MLFNSYIFVLLFLPITIIGYFSLNKFNLHKPAMVLLLGMSLWFYGYFNQTYLVIMIGSILVNFLIYKSFKLFKDNQKIKKCILVFGLALNIAVLFYFKYFNFFIDNINSIFKTDFFVESFLLPLGISFFTFQQLSFVIDSYKGEVLDYNIIEYACFVSFFPQLVAGPIVTHDELVPQFSDISKKKFDWNNFSKGLYAFAIGMAKKVLIADVIGNAVNWGYGNINSLNTTSSLLVTILYTFQIYFDFSGYSDMAIGMGKMLNIELPINFNSPYKATTINEFWDRWHITLTRFFTKYIYIPLGGNRKGKGRTYLNIMIVYLISGIWHGSNWTFIFWGVCHGVFCVITRHFNKFFKNLHPALNWIITFSFVNLMWVFFRADSMNDAFCVVKKLCIADFGVVPKEFISTVITAEWSFISSQISFMANNQGLILMAYLVVSLVIVLGTKNVKERLQSFKPSVFTSLMISFLLVLCIMSFSGVSTFLYFNWFCKVKMKK